MIRLFSAVGQIILPVCLFFFTGCGGSVDENSFTVPRGATISVILDEPLSPLSHPKGATFAARLESPLQRDHAIYAPLESKLEGVVERSTANAGEAPEIAIRLTRLWLPSGQQIELKTNRITRSGALGGGGGGEVSITEGFEETIRRMVGESGDPAGGGDKSDTNTAGPALISAGTPLVFTLDKALVIPAPE